MEKEWFMKGMVDHLKTFHNGVVCQASDEGKTTVSRVSRNSGEPVNRYAKDANWIPRLFPFNNQIFVLQAYMRDYWARK